MLRGGVCEVRFGMSPGNDEFNLMVLNGQDQYRLNYYSGRISWQKFVDGRYVNLSA